MRSLALAALLMVLAPRAEAATSQETFFARVGALCGKSFAGRVVTTDAADAAFVGKTLIMHVRTCDPNEIRIPFHVGEDRSRTWVVSRVNTGLRLKHDHRHPDGIEDAVSQYGGDATTPGTVSRQDFPADRFSKELFIREDRAVSVTNVWAMEVEPGRIFAYELRRPDRHFRVEFDLAAPVSPAP